MIQEILTHVPGNAPLGRKFISSYLPENEDKWAGLALINARTNTVRGTLTPLYADGKPGEPIEYTIEPTSRTLVLLDNPEQYTHLLVESITDITVFAITGGMGQLATVPVFPVVE